LRYEPCKRHRDSKVFEERTVNHVKGRQLPKENHHEQRYHKPSHLTERERERELKVVDCINDFLHAPYACIAFDFLQFSQLLSFLKWKQQPVFQGCCIKNTSVISLADDKIFSCNCQYGHSNTP